MSTDLRHDIDYLDDTILLTKKEAWTWLAVPAAPYDYLESGTQAGNAAQLSTLLQALIGGGTNRVGVHLITRTETVDALSWADQLYTATVQKAPPKPAMEPLIAGMADRVDRLGLYEKRTYLGVRLGTRGTLPQSGAAITTETLRTIGRGLIDSLSGSRSEPTDIAAWTREATRVRAMVEGKAHPVDAATVVSLVKGMWHPGNPPAREAHATGGWTRDQISLLLDVDVLEHPRHVEVMPGGNTGGCVAAMTVHRFPDTLTLDSTWALSLFGGSFPVQYVFRGEVVPHQAVKKDVERKIKDAHDQASHIAESGTQVPLGLQRQLSTATEAQDALDQERVPWLYGTHYVRVWAPGEEQIAAAAAALRNTLKDLEIDAVAPARDQVNALAQMTPGGETTGAGKGAYGQRQDLSILAVGAPTADVSVGDPTPQDNTWQGPYIGYTTNRITTPVFFSPHVAMACNRPPGVAITGAPGGGKSFLAFTLAYQMAASGAACIYLDPKADAVPMGGLQGLGEPRVFDLRNGADGMLDPFSMGDTNSESRLLALETLRLLLGGHVSEEREEALLAAVEAVGSSEHPSLRRVVEHLNAHPTSTGARNLGAVLRTIQELPFARLCFAPTSGTRLNPEDGLTIVTLLGLDLPSATTPAADYSYENRLATSVMYLLVRYARKLMLSLDKSMPKAILIDEAWALTSTPQGAKLMPEIARMGRSHNTAVVAISQNAGDLMEEAVTNSMSTKFAFRSEVDAEIEDVLRLLGVPLGQGYERQIRELHNGECLMADPHGRIARVQIDAWNPELKAAFDTNPLTRGKAGQAA